MHRKLCAESKSNRMSIGRWPVTRLASMLAGPPCERTDVRYVMAYEMIRPAREVLGCLPWYDFVGRPTTAVATHLCQGGL